MELETSIGLIKVKRRKNSTNITAKIGLTGQLEITCPKYMPKFMIKSFVESNQAKLLPLIKAAKAKICYQNGSKISKNKKLQIIFSPKSNKIRFSEQSATLTVCVPNMDFFNSPEVQQKLKLKIKKILKQEAEQFLTPRINLFAKKFDFHFNQLKFKHTSTRWGSCTSTGVITLNIALMKLPDKLIDQVLIHELCHLRHQNHSQAFWNEVGKYSPNYKSLEQELKQYSPYI